MDNHTHCIICGSYKEVPEGEYAKYYICDRCAKSFPDSYLLYRIDCREKGIFRNSFNLLEERLTLGDRNLPDNPPLFSEEIMYCEDVLE